MNFGKPPENRKHRMDVLQKMVAHAQFCMSGDHTVEAMEKAIQRVAQGDESDQNIVVVVSDANFERYGILPQDIGTIMVRAVTMCVRSQLPQIPAPHANVCLVRATAFESRGRLPFGDDRIAGGRGGGAAARAAEGRCAHLLPHGGPSAGVQGDPHGSRRRSRHIKINSSNKRQITFFPSLSPAVPMITCHYMYFFHSSHFCVCVTLLAQLLLHSLYLLPPSSPNCRMDSAAHDDLVLEQHSEIQRSIADAQVSFTHEKGMKRA